MKFFHLTDIDRAQTLLADACRAALRQTTTVDLRDAVGQVIADAVRAHEPVPVYTKAIVDGYAVCAHTCEGASDTVPALLTLDGDIAMGEAVITPLAPLGARRIPTGGMVPPGADAVVMIEDSDTLGDDVFIRQTVAPGDNVIYEGEDLKPGDVVCEAGTLVTAAVVSALAALGQTTVTVHPTWRVAILSTGDELRPLDATLTPGTTRDSNRYALEALVRRLGLSVVMSVHCPDQREAIDRALATATNQADLVLISGGSSIGEKDHTADAVRQAARRPLLFHGLKAKPGKPTLAAQGDDTIYLGLPGHPSSCLMMAQILLSETLRRLGRLGPPPQPLRATLREPVRGAAGKRTFVPVRLTPHDGGLVATPIRGESGFVSCFARAAGYFVIDDHEEGVLVGSDVDVAPFL